MSQLFICHTQYNLILAVGSSTHNDELILFKDFNLTDELKKKLNHHFKRCLILQGNYPKRELSAKEKYTKISVDTTLIKRFIGSYDRIFIVDDMCIQEMYALKCAYKKNNKIEMSWLEDGAIAYFPNGVVSTGMGSTSIKRAIRKYAFSFRFGLWGFYDLASCMGGHKRLTSAYVIFPKNIRCELKNKNLIEIYDEQFKTGMEFMYGGRKYEFESGSTLIAMDKLDVYGDKLDKVESLVSEIVKTSKGKIYYKYHPRETDTLNALSDCIELDRTIALESYLTNSNTKDITIIGIKSTALQTAKKMGYNTKSLINNIEINDAVVNFYKAIGVEC